VFENTVKMQSPNKGACLAGTKPHLLFSTLGNSMTSTTIIGIHKLTNGRTYRITDTGQPYTNGEYPSGGLLICVLLRDDDWSYVDNSPDEDCAKNFLRAASKLARLP
jgi:hypothetical protein